MKNGITSKLSILAILSLSLVFIMFSTQSHAIDAKSIVGIWLFDEGKGETAKDSTGNKNDGTLKGSIKWVKGKYGQALEFSGTDNNFVEVPHNDSLTLETFSFTMWVKLQPTANYQSVLIKTASVFWTRFMSGGSCAFQKFGKTAITDDKWHHLAGTYDMKSVKSYVDGVVEADAPFTGKPDPSPGSLYMGDYPAYPYPIKGIIDDVGLFKVALSDNDIKTLMDKGLSTATAVSGSGKLATVWGDVKRLD
jgi:hypothetical protein